MIKKRLLNSIATSLVCGFILSACGGGGGSTFDGPLFEWEQGDYPDADLLADVCELPRSSDEYSDRQGTELDEKMWLRSWSDELYLWYDEIEDNDPANYSISEYFSQLKTEALTPSGRPKDNYHFAVETEAYNQQSQSGVSSGYGMKLAIINDSPRTITVIYSEPNSPAAEAGISRGALLLSIDGVDATSGTESGIAVLNAGLFPSEAGETHSFTVMDLNGASTRTVDIISADVVSDPVPNTQSFQLADKTVGYMLFNQHIATAEQALFTAVSSLESANIDELVHDIRYNGGGYLAIASQLSYMIAGAAATQDRVFEFLQFNDKSTTRNPVTGASLSPTPFYDETRGFSLSSGQSLPTLDLQRVFVLTGSGTCSASESIINSLRGINVEVIQIGENTCGKPYGFYAADNCGTTYFSIQFQGSNDQGFGEYPDGFSPSNSDIVLGVSVPGCQVADDLEHVLGDVEEARLAAALHYIEEGTCPTEEALSDTTGFAKPSQDYFEPQMIGLHAWQVNRIMDGI